MLVALLVTTVTCTARLMNRLAFGGHLQTALVTDDHDEQESTT